ncbi:MAG: DciA family protein [Candidatus Nanopelagicales bacterium]
MTTDRGDAAAKALNRAVGGGTSRRKSSKGTRPASSSTSRDPQPIGDAVSELIAQRGWTQERAGAQVTTLWPQIVGADLASHVTPASFDEGVLTLQADSTTWATQVRHLLPQLRKAIDTSVGSGVVTDIRILGPAGPTWKSGLRHVKGRGPRDTYG